MHLRTHSPNDRLTLRVSADAAGSMEGRNERRRKTRHAGGFSVGAAS